MTIEYKGSARSPGPLDGTVEVLGGRIPGPLRFGHVNAPATIATAAVKILPMPAPASLEGKILRARSVPWPLSNSSPRLEDVEQGDLANCPIPAILAALVHTVSGWKRVNSLITEYPGVPVTTTFSQTVIDTLLSTSKDDPDYKPPKKEIASKGYFSVSLETNFEVSDVFYIKYTDGNDIDLPYMGAPNKATWPAVIEKAYAVKVGGYQQLNDEKIQAPDFWKVLVGSSPKGFKIDDVDLTRIAEVAKAAGSVPAIAGSRKETTNGVIKDHAHAILGIRSAKKLEESIIELFNPWGNKVPLSLEDFRSNFFVIYYGSP